jgi:hypothetical protein
MRTMFALLISTVGLSCPAQTVHYSVDLAKPGAMDRLEESNPDHYAKVLAVVRVASRPSCVDELKLLRVELDLDDATCFAMTTLTSLPAKRNVSVTIDGVRYMTYAAIGFEPAKARRLRSAPKIVPAEP